MRNKIKAIYSELQGYLSQAPTADKGHYLYDAPLWEQLHRSIDELNQISKKDYSKFKVNVIHDEGGPHIITNEYRSNINGLIMRLHAEYFSEDQLPFSGSPSTVIKQTQKQSQTAQIVMIMDFQSLIDKRLYSSEVKGEEKTFLEKIKARLPFISSIAELLSSILSIAKDSNFDIDKVIQILGLK
jgi:hypothetical protein